MAEATRTEIDSAVPTGLLRLKPPRIAMVCLLIGAGLHFLLRNHLGIHFRSPACGAILIVLGFSLMMWAWWIFRREQTAICPTGAATVLVQRGPFHLTRNPMYTGMTLMLAGCACLMGTLPALFAPIAFFFLMNAVFIPFEERRLSGIFGPQYAGYRRRVRRWL